VINSHIWSKSVTARHRGMTSAIMSQYAICVTLSNSWGIVTPTCDP
jgi:hypothetical protein